MRATLLWVVTFGAAAMAAGEGVRATGQAAAPARAVQPQDGVSAPMHQPSVVALGKRLFFDQRLSANTNQACAVCHGREVGWTGPDAPVNQHGSVYEGSVTGRFGNRKPPSSAYATFAPLFSYDAGRRAFAGGNFWDGRATGWKLGSPAADQAEGPFLNPVEQALPGAPALMHRVCTGAYAALFRRVWGPEACNQTDRGFADVALSVAAFEGSDEVNRFASKFDAVMAGRLRLAPIERAGFELFTGKARCANCHTATSRKAGEPVLFTDFTYDNLGVPRNRENPFYGMDNVLVDGSPINPQGAAFVDEGLGGFLKTLAQDGSWRSSPHLPDAMKKLTGADLAKLAVQNLGKQRVPTLRNVDKRPRADSPKAYMHNGYFKTLEGLVHFYNTRDKLRRCPGDLTEREALAQNCWPAPEISQNVNTADLGDLGLTSSEEAAVVAFLRTLSDEDSF